MSQCPGASSGAATRCATAPTRPRPSIGCFLERLADAGRTLIATQSTNPRALPVDELAARAESHFDHVEAIADPHEALARARALGGPVLITGSLYLLADLHS
jgi:folylpolyglutamate synthase/dihydropteroate synthase